MSQSENASPDITVSIVSYNTRELLRACLQSLKARQEAGEAALEVVVADNGSTDGSIGMLSSEFPWVAVVETGGNIGYGRANNAALDGAQGRYFLILNSDTEVEPGALAAMRDFLDGHHEAGAVGPKLILPNGSTQPSCFERATLRSVFWEQTYLQALLPGNRITSGFPITYGDYNCRRAVAALSGACILVRRESFAQIGGFDPNYFMYFEDIDLCTRLCANGAQIWFLPEARIRHKLGASSDRDWRLRARMIVAYNQSRYLYFTRHGGRLHGLMLKALVLLGAMLRLATWSLLSLLRPKAREQVKMFWAVWRQTWKMSISLL